jgi:uncharacterized protein YoxC
VLIDGYNELNQSTRTLAKKHHDVVNTVNLHSQHLQTLNRAVADVDRHASFVEDKVARMKKEAGKTIKGIAARITAIEEACAQMVTVLTQQLTAQCQTFQDTLNGFSAGLDTAYERLDEFRLAEQ